MATAAKMVEAKLTPGGNWLPAPVITRRDRRTEVKRPCVWCNAYDQEELDNIDPMLLDMARSRCGACGGKGWEYTESAADAILRQWEEEAFYVDAKYYELRDYDCCGYCGMGGGHYEDEECPRAPQVDWLLDAISGQEIPVIVTVR